MIRLDLRTDAGNTCNPKVDLVMVESSVNEVCMCVRELECRVLNYRCHGKERENEQQSV